MRVFDNMMGESSGREKPHVEDDHDESYHDRGEPGGAVAGNEY